MPHSYEELRTVALDIFAGRETTEYSIDQYEELSLSIGFVLARREGRTNPTHYGASYPLDVSDKELFLELFWDLFRQGIITLGKNDSNREFPFFHLTKLGQKLASSSSVYFFHDVSSYEAAVKREVPDISSATVIYLKEAMQAFQSGCLLSSTVMLGVAAEHTFMLLLEIIEANPKQSVTFASVFNERERTLLQKFCKFRNILDNHIKSLPTEVREDLDIHLSGILSVIRTFRNNAGHPTGVILDREQVFVLLQMIIPYCKKQYQLMKVYK